MALKAVKAKTSESLGITLRTRPDYSTLNVTRLFLDILKAKYEADDELRDVLVCQTGDKYLLEFDRGAERLGKAVWQNQNAEGMSRWAGMIRDGHLWGLNLQGELQMTLRSWFRSRC